MKKLILSFVFLCVYFVASAQVGIGTTSPEATLDVRATNHLGAATTTDGILIPRINDLSVSGSEDGQLVYLIAAYGSFDKGFHYWDQDAMAWVPINSTVEPWYDAADQQPATSNTANIYTLGQVGIGTNNPLGALHVSTENSRDVLFLRFIDGLDDDLDLDLFRALGTLASPSLLPNNTRIGGLRGQSLTNASTYAFQPSAEIYFQADGATSSSSSAGKIKFATTPSGAISTVDRMVIRNDGKVGIGTNEPIEHIEVKRAGDNDMQFTSASNNPPNLIFYNTGGSLDAPGLTGANQEIGSMIFKTHDGSGVREIGGLRLYMDGTPTNGSTPSKFVISTTPSGTTNQVEVVTIDNQGYMGIGVTDPQAKLDVAGSVKIADGNEGNGKVLTSDANGNATWQTPASSGSSSGWGLNGNTTSASNFLGTTNYQPLFFRINNTQVAKLDPHGGITIGLGAVANDNNSIAIGRTASASANNNAVAVGYNANASGYESTAVGRNSSATNNSSLALGTGTSASGLNSTALGVNATASGQNATALGYGANATNPTTIILGNATVASDYNGTKVGIGTNAPTAKLQVNGTLRYVDGTQGNGKVLASDANCNASWQSISGIPQIVAAGLVQANGTAIKITGATVTRLNLGDYQVTFTSARASANYIINLANIDCGGNCGGTSYDDPGITYYDRETTGFKVNIGDSDNGNTQKADIDLEFTFSVIDF